MLYEVITHVELGQDPLEQRLVEDRSREVVLDAALANAALNGLQDRVEARQGSAPETMAALRAEGRRFDVVILDPPAFIQRRKDLRIV